MRDRPTSRTLPRPARQLLLGLLPLLLVGAALLGVLALRLPGAQAPLAAATATATATVVAAGQPPAGRGLTVSFPGGVGGDRAGRLVLRESLEVPPGSTVTVQYDPVSVSAVGGTTPVYADGDAAHAAVRDLVFGLVLVSAVALLAVARTARVVLRVRRLRRAGERTVTATRIVVRQGLLVRSWLELDTARRPRWLPVFWTPELARLPPGGRLVVRGDPTGGRAVLASVDGSEVWPSGRLRDRAPRGEQQAAPGDPAAGAVGLARQARGDAVLPIAAPVFGLLWAYVDGSGVAGFVVAGVLAAAVLFWLPQLLGSDPSPPDRR